MVSRKRGRAEMEASEPPAEQSLLTRLRNTWEFANVMQYIFIFGKAVKIDDDFDIEDFESECMRSESSEKLAEIGLNLLKFVSSHRGLTSELFDEYTRRQFVAKAPDRNPFGTEEAPKKFAEFDIFTKLRVLFQLSQWTLINADRMREKMFETKDSEQTSWRIEEVGYDRDERLYFVLDDNRLYRRTDPPPPPPPAPKLKPKSKSSAKARIAGSRASKRRKTTDIDEPISEIENGGEEEEEENKAEAEDDGFGGRKWECIAVTLIEYQEFLESIRKSKDADEKALHSRLTKEVLPVIEKLEEDRQKKIARRQRELMNLEKLATAKRSSRIAGKQEREREEAEAAALERQKQLDLTAAKKDAERQKQMEEARESRMMTREQRLKDREYKRLLHEEELANLSEDSKKLETGEARLSERHLKAEMEKKKKELAALEEEEEWIFDCSKCGVHGENIDDGSHSVACERCSVWQHSACLGISQDAAEKDDFQFVCSDCKRKEEDARKPKIPTLKFRIGTSASPPSTKSVKFSGHLEATQQKEIPGSTEDTIQLSKNMNNPQETVQSNGFHHNSGRPTYNANSMHMSIMNGPTLSPQGQILPVNGVNGQQNRPPPGLASPVRSSPYSNGYQQHSPLSNHIRPPSQAATNGFRHTNQAPVGLGLSESIPQASLSLYQPSPSQQTTPSQPRQLQHSGDPFHNSFERQRPSSSHSINSSNGFPSPIKNRLSMTPSQNYSEVGPLGFPPIASTPQPNGLTPYRSTWATHPSAYTTAKDPLSSPPPASYASSPVMAPPVLDSSAPMSGLSPEKHSPPRPTSSHSIGSTPVLPPIRHLSPSPQVQNLHVPVKGMTPEQPRPTNGPINGL